MKIKVEEFPDEQMFTAVIEENQDSPETVGLPVGEMMYIPRDAYLDVYHTGIKPEFEGLGLASQLAKGAMDIVRKNGRKVYPRCPYLQHWLDKHPDYSDVVYE
ncbi:MAG: N-acetyltransferase [Candidatus Ancillula sp.]|jgi:predicted GNAT family acetyltransferase|nr:N-acetyltransferase [Candidatus Ancillula sp.]